MKRWTALRPRQVTQIMGLKSRSLGPGSEKVFAKWEDFWVALPVALSMTAGNGYYSLTR